MFGSKDVCILKMTIDFNGSMNPPFLTLYIFLYMWMCVYMCVHSSTNKYVLKAKKGKGTLFWKGIDKCMINVRSQNSCPLYDIFSHKGTNTSTKPPRVMFPNIFELSLDCRIGYSVGITKTCDCIVYTFYNTFVSCYMFLRSLQIFVCSIAQNWKIDGYFLYFTE